MSLINDACTIYCTSTKAYRLRSGCEVVHQLEQIFHEPRQDIAVRLCFASQDTNAHMHDSTRVVEYVRNLHSGVAHWATCDYRCPVTQYNEIVKVWRKVSIQPQILLRPRASHSPKVYE